jgi:hypothetical protein
VAAAATLHEGAIAFHGHASLEQVDRDNQQALVRFSSWHSFAPLVPLLPGQDRPSIVPRLGRRRTYDVRRGLPGIGEETLSDTLSSKNIIRRVLRRRFY